MKNPIKYLAGTIAVSIILTSVFQACKKNPDSDSNQSPAPVISSFQPSVSAPGGTVVIYGEQFTTDKNAVTVTINGKAAAVSFADSSELSVVVPMDATNGKLTVTIDRKTVSSSNDLSINANAPSISEVAPATAAIGEEVTITGKKFGNNFTVLIGDKAVEAQAASATSFKIIIPEGTNNGRISVQSNGLTALSPLTLYTPARITTTSSTTGMEGTEITLSGENFATRKRNIEVFFGDNAATTEDIISLTSTEIKVKAPARGTNGQLLIKQFGTISNGSDFNYIPSISSFDPAFAEPGGMMMIHGRRFGTGNIVRINGTQAQIMERTSTSLQVAIPYTATGGRVEVRAGDKSVYATEDIIIVNAWQNINVTNPFDIQSRSPFVIGTKAYFLGMYDLKIFDLPTLTWSDGPQKPAAFEARYSQVTIVKNGKAYIGTGARNETSYPLKDWWEFDPASATPWKRLTDYPENTSYAFGLISNNTLYIGMGQTLDPESKKKFYPFNPEGNGSWGQPIEITEEISVANMTFTLNGTPYFGSGGSLHKFEPGAANPIPKVAGFPIGSYSGYVDQSRSPSIGNKGYLYFQNRFFEFNPATNDWTELTARNFSYSSRMVNISERLIAFDGQGVYEYIRRR